MGIIIVIESYNYLNTHRPKAHLQARRVWSRAYVSDCIVFLIVFHVCAQIIGMQDLMADDPLSNVAQLEEDPCAARTEIDPALMERLESEAPKAFHQLRLRSAHQQGSYHKTRSKKWISNDSQSVSTKYALNGDNLKVEFQQKGLMNVLCKNHDYAFQISKPADQPGSQYTIQWLEQRRVNGTIDKVLEDRELQFYPLANLPWWFMGRTFSESIKEPGFEIRGVTPARDSRIRVDYSYTPVDGSISTQKEAIPSAYVVFDPDLDWAICEGGFCMPWGFNRWVTEYNRTDSGLLAPVTSGMIIQGNDGSKLEDAYMYEGVTDQPPPLEEFRLSHYGLPEPNFNSGGLMWLVYLGAAVCLFAMAYIWRRRQLA